MNAPLALGALLAIIAAPFGAAESSEVTDTHATAGDRDAAHQYDADAAGFERKAGMYAMAARQYRAAGKPITLFQATRAAEFTDRYRQLAAQNRERAIQARRPSEQ